MHQYTDVHAHQHAAPHFICLILVQVVQYRRQVKSHVASFEKLIAKQLQQVSALKPYARQPYLAYITWGALAAPIGIIFLLPFLLFGGDSLPYLQSSASNFPSGTAAVEH